MNPINPFKLLGIVDSLFIPIQRAIALVLPDFLEEQLDDPDVRDRIVDAADAALVNAAPEARLIPKPIRKRLINRFLDIMLDDVLLPE